MPNVTYKKWSEIPPSNEILSTDKILLNGTKRVPAFRFATQIPPSNDTSGVTDLANIQNALDTNGHVLLGAGTYYINDTITMTSYSSLSGVGRNSIIQASTSVPSIVKIGETATNSHDVIVRDVWLEGTLASKYATYGIHFQNGTQCYFDRVRVAHTSSHGIYAEDNNWTTNFTDCEVWGADGDGINMVSVDGTTNGNALNIKGGMIRTCAGIGLRWAANTLSVCGTIFEDNAIGIKLESSSTAFCRGTLIAGCHFEDNASYQIMLYGLSGQTVEGVSILGNKFHQNGSVTTHIGILGDADAVRDVIIDRGNAFAGNATYYVWHNGALQYGWIEVDSTKFYEGTTSLATLVDRNGSIWVDFNSSIGYGFGRPTGASSWWLTPTGSSLRARRYESSVWKDKILFKSDGSIAPSGGFQPATFADASAPNNSVYYSSDQSKLCYKDFGGTPHTLY